VVVSATHAPSKHPLYDQACDGERSCGLSTFEVHSLLKIILIVIVVALAISTSSVYLTFKLPKITALVSTFFVIGVTAVWLFFASEAGDVFGM